MSRIQSASLIRTCCCVCVSKISLSSWRALSLQNAFACLFPGCWLWFLLFLISLKLVREKTLWDFFNPFSLFTGLSISDTTCFSSSSVLLADILISKHLELTFLRRRSPEQFSLSSRKTIVWKFTEHISKPFCSSNTTQLGVEKVTLNLCE